MMLLTPLLLALAPLVPTAAPDSPAAQAAPPAATTSAPLAPRRISGREHPELIPEERAWYGLFAFVDSISEGATDPDAPTAQDLLRTSICHGPTAACSCVSPDGCARGWPSWSKSTRATWSRAAPLRMMMQPRASC